MHLPCSWPLLGGIGGRSSAGLKLSANIGHTHSFTARESRALNKVFAPVVLFMDVNVIPIDATTETSLKECIGPLWGPWFSRLWKPSGPFAVLAYLHVHCLSPVWLLGKGVRSVIPQCFPSFWFLIWAYIPTPAQAHGLQSFLRGQTCSLKSLPLRTI